MAFTVALCDDDAAQIKNLRRLLGEWSERQPFIGHNTMSMET